MVHIVNILGSEPTSASYLAGASLSMAGKSHCMVGYSRWTQIQISDSIMPAAGPHTVNLSPTIYGIYHVLLHRYVQEYYVCKYHFG